MIQRPSVMNEYKNVNDYSFKQAMERDISLAVIQYNDNNVLKGPNVGSFDVGSYQAISPNVMESFNSGRSFNSNVKNLTKGSPIQGPLNSILGYSGSKKSLSVLRNGLRQTLQPPMEFGKNKKHRLQQVEVSILQKFLQKIFIRFF